MENNSYAYPLIMDSRIGESFKTYNFYDEELRLWKNRVKRYFPELYRNALEFRFRTSIVDKHHRQKSVLILENDGSIFEVFVNTLTDSAEAKKCSDENVLFSLQTK